MLLCRVSKQRLVSPKQPLRPCAHLHSLMHTRTAHGAWRTADTLQLCALRSFSFFSCGGSIPNSALRVQKCVGRNVALVTEAVFARAAYTSPWSWCLVAASRWPKLTRQSADGSDSSSAFLKNQKETVGWATSRVMRVRPCACVNT